MIYLLKGDDRFEQRTTVQGLLTRLENKSGVLLTHISMMATVAGVLLGIQSTGAKAALSALNHKFLAMDFVAYLTLAVLCVRCQFHVGSRHRNSLALKTIQDVPPDKRHVETEDILRDQNRDTLDLMFRGEVYYREQLFRFCFLGLYLLTVVLCVVILFSLFDVDVFEYFGALISKRP